MAFAFRQLWDGLDFPRVGSDLVSLPAVICGVVADCFRDHARDCSGRNWSWQSFGRIAFIACHLDRILLPILLLTAAILVLLSYLFFPGELIQAPTGVFDLRWWQIAILCIALMFPVALFSGILFPVYRRGGSGAVWVTG